MLFFTGTDTDVGKTHTVRAITKYLRANGQRVRVCKPVATGAGLFNGSLLSDDTRQLAAAAGAEPEEVTRWTFPEPLAPSVAARLNGVTLTIKEIASFVNNCQHGTDPLLVEGVGGLLCPLTETETVADLIEALRCPLIIVARRSLGTLNHTLLTLEVARRRGLDVRGLIVSETQPPLGLAEETNVAELIRLAETPLLAVLKWKASSPIGQSIADVNWAQLAAPNSINDPTAR